MGSVARGVEIEDHIRDLIVPGLGNRRIFRVLLADACRYSCDDCPMRAERDLPRRALEPARLARLFMTAFRRGWCDGLFVTSGIPKDAAQAMGRMLELVELLRVTHGYRGYLHVKALAGAEPGQIEKLVRLVDRVSYSLEARCQRALDEHAPCKDLGEVPGPLPAAAHRGRKPERAPLSFAEGLERKKHILLKDYGFRADELLFEKDAHLPLDQDPKLAWALRHPERFPVDLTTATREELCRVPGFGPLAVERILAVRASETLRDLSDLRRFGVRVARAAGFVSLRGRTLGSRVVQAGLFSGSNDSSRKTYDVNSSPVR